MKLPAGTSSVSEEITNIKQKPKELPFISIDRYLKDQGLPVPTIHAYDEKEGLLLLEDFGDETLEKRIGRSSSGEQEAWYRTAIDLLVLFQKKGMAKKDSVAHQRSFDETLLNWEFDHFLEYGITARTGQKILDDDLRSLHQGFNFITFALTKLPQTLVHRDFQSRNLMVHNDALKLLDFQDALLGPLPYDLVALLRDSYISLSGDQVGRLIDHYLSARQKETGEKQDPLLFKKMFDWMTIQRKLKDAGRFVYIDQVKKNPSFLRHIPNSLQYVRTAFERQPELKGLFETLKKYVPEFIVNGGRSPSGANDDTS